jgi:hypothetical protein
MERNAGLVIVALGMVAVVFGLLVWAGAFRWFGRLPGDLRYEGERTRVYVPLASMLVLSVVASLALWLAGRFWR